MTWLAIGSIMLSFVLIGVLIWSWGIMAARIAAEQEAAEREIQEQLDSYRGAR
jgi:hypothetical protein